MNLSLQYKRLAKILSPHIEGKVLDLGCGDGRLANLLGVFEKLDVRPCAGKQYGGYHIPYPDKFFDTVMIVNVLHHARDPGYTIKEALRVGRKILIKDNYWESRFDLFLLYLAEYVWKIYGLGEVYKFSRLEDWIKLGGEIKTFRIKGSPFKHILIIKEMGKWQQNCL